jgi:hypothetical protein
VRREQNKLSPILRPSIEEFRNYNPELFRGLNVDGSKEELLSAEEAFTYADMVFWLTRHAAIVSPGGIPTL